MAHGSNKKKSTFTIRDAPSISHIRIKRIRPADSPLISTACMQEASASSLMAGTQVTAAETKEDPIPWEVFYMSVAALESQRTHSKVSREKGV